MMVVEDDGFAASPGRHTHDDKLCAGVVPEKPEVGGVGNVQAGRLTGDGVLMPGIERQGQDVSGKQLLPIGRGDGEGRDLVFYTRVSRDAATSSVPGSRQAHSRANPQYCGSSTPLHHSV